MAAETSPTARALQALEVVRNRPGTTAAELARRLDVSDRAARRYVAILREAGVPITSLRGPHGGYRLAHGTRLAPVAFAEEEAVALVMAVLDTHPAPGDRVDSALDKVVRVLPDALARQATVLREHASAAPDRRTRPDPGTTSALVAAVAQRHRVSLEYLRSSGSSWRNEVDPWAVVVRHGRWYLLCHSHHADAVRTYRIDRIVSVEEQPESATVPTDLDPVTCLEEHLGRGWEHETRVVFDAPLAEVARWVRRPMGRLEPCSGDSPGDGGRCVLLGSTSNPTMYAAEWLAPIPLPFRVEGGPELRAAMAALAARLTAAST